MLLPVVYAVTDADKLSENVFCGLQRIVSAERRERAGRFYRREDACRSLLAECLIRYTMSISGVHGNSDITLVKNEFGKPEAAIGGFHFNVSHSGSWVVCAFDNQEIGIDIERIHKIDKGISERFFSSKESDLLSCCRSGPEWADLFFKLWVLKESYIKAIGRGLYCSLSSFTVLPRNDGTVEFEKYEESLPGKFFKLYSIDSAYRCALCCSHRNFPEKIGIVTPQRILDTLE